MAIVVEILKMRQWIEVVSALSTQQKNQEKNRIFFGGSSHCVCTPFISKLNSSVGGCKNCMEEKKSYTQGLWNYVESVLVKIECLSLRIHVDLNPLTWITISSFVPLDNKSWFTVVKKLCCHFCKCYF